MASAVQLEPQPAITGTRPAAVRDAQLHHPAVLVMRQGRGLAGGADGHQAVHAAATCRSTSAYEGVLVHRAVTERSDQGGDDALEQRVWEA